MEDNIHEAETSSTVKLDQIDQPGTRILGSAAGLIQYSENWDAPMSDLGLGEFLGSST